MENNFFCPQCKGLLKHTNYGLICGNKDCPSHKFQKDSFVKDRKNPQYGIGRILEALDNDIYLVNFKSEKYKIYAEDLEKFILPKGTMVKTKMGQGIISEYTSPAGQSFYKILFPSGLKTVKEEMIEEILPASPIEKMKSGELDVPKNFALKIMAKYFQIAQYSEDLICIWNSRVDLLPHQVGVTHRVVQDYSPRFILADEVGLGKTMEAGLIMKELKSRGLVNRTLIVTPASLVTQWQQELKSKFNERFEVFDSRSEAVYRSSNPERDVFSLYDNVLCSIHYAKNRIEEFSNQFWDLIIFDEAHHLRRQLSGKDVRYTKNYRFAEAMRDRCGGMLLLTATPMQLDPFEFYSLIELIDPSLFGYYELFEWYNDDYAPAIKRTLAELKNIDWAELEKTDNKEINDMNLKMRILDLLKNGVKYFPQEIISKETDNYIEKEYTEKQLENFLVIPKIMIRNRKREVFKHHPKRVVKTIGVDYTEEEVLLYEEISEFVRDEYNKALRENQNAIGFVMVIFQKMLTSSKYTILKSFRKRLAILNTQIRAEFDFNESEFEEMDETEHQIQLDNLLTSFPQYEEVSKLKSLCEKIENFSYDSKIDAVINAVDAILEKDSKEKILLFTQFIATQELLKERLSKKYEVVIFNGQMSKEEKDESAEKFKKSAQIMISTEAGGEGRNFQFCHIIFNFDLPWNPMKLEQRIGRIDRIGQKRNVMIYNFSTIDTVEQRVLDVLYERVERFREIIGEMEPILGDLEKDVRKVIMSQKDDLEEEFEKLEKSIDEKLEEARYIQTKIEDFLMDTRQFNYETVDQILGKKPVISPDNLKEFIKTAVVDLGDNSRFEEKKGSYFIRLPLSFKRIKCNQTEYLGTFNQTIARENDKLEFFAFGHELVSDILWHYTNPFEPSCTVIDGDGDQKGYLSLYSIEMDSISSKEIFLPVFINEDRKYDPAHSEKYLETIKNYPDSQASLTNIDFDDIDVFNEIAESVVADFIYKETSEVQKRHEDLFNKEHIRIGRLFHFRRSKLDDELKKEKELFQRIKKSNDSKQKKILPAIEGRIRSITERINNLENEKKERLEKLKNKKEIKTSYSLLGIVKIL